MKEGPIFPDKENHQRKTPSDGAILLFTFINLIEYRQFIFNQPRSPSLQTVLLPRVGGP